MSEQGWPFGGRPRPRKIWALWKAGLLAECEINEHPLGHEMRFYERGDLLYAQVHAMRELAEADAAEQRRQLLTEGWTDRPAMPR